MPLYDYECKNCGREWEDMISISSRDDVICDCSAHAVRVVSGGNFLLVGGGWTGRAHPIIHQPKGAGVESKNKMKTHYHNCTPESVHET